MPIIPPIVSKQKQPSILRVNLADASPVKISSVSEHYEFETPKLDPIKFSGSLSVTEFQEHDAALKDGGTLLKPKEVDHLRSENKAKKLVSSSPVMNMFVKELDGEESAVVAISVQDTVEPVYTNTDAVLQTPVEEVSDVRFAPVLTAVFVGFAVVFVILGLESHILLLPVEEVMVTNYAFGIENFLASISSATGY